jgi:hypothetical protein
MLRWLVLLIIAAACGYGLASCAAPAAPTPAPTPAPSPTPNPPYGGLFAPDRRGAPPGGARPHQILHPGGV